MVFIKIQIVQKSIHPNSVSALKVFQCLLCLPDFCKNGVGRAGWQMTQYVITLLNSIIYRSALNVNRIFNYYSYYVHTYSKNIIE